MHILIFLHYCYLIFILSSKEESSNNAKIIFHFPPNTSYYPYLYSQNFFTCNLLIREVSHTRALGNDGSKLPFLAQEMNETQHNITHKPFQY